MVVKKGRIYYNKRFEGESHVGQCGLHLRVEKRKKTNKNLIKENPPLTFPTRSLSKSSLLLIFFL